MRLVSLLVALFAFRIAYADDGVATYAIVVGSNAGGAGQGELRYAEDDARRFGKLLTELGGYRADQVDVVVHPSPDELRARIAKLGEKLAEDDKAGRATRVLFYYSGHAKATALDLGSDELPLPELRQKLFDLPSKLTVVVLDACQSGAFSRVKGAAPAADFSFNSRQQLDATGVAVLASSSGSELSQESEQLRSSYFTHHLLVGLRGAGDSNNDGQVTVDEAYRYAYHQTLLATAETAVGGQHVSLEVDLKGHGEVPLSFPKAATAHIELPASLEGKTLIEDKKAQTVVAETYKAKGHSIRVAVAPGDYSVIVRHPTTLSRCDVDASGNLAHCKDEAIVEERTKGGSQLPKLMRVELLGYIGGERDDAYTQRLSDFGYKPEFAPITGGLQMMITQRRNENLWLGGVVGLETLPKWTRDSPGVNPQTLEWKMYTIGAAAHGELPWGHTTMLRRLKLYGNAIVGLGIGRTEHHDEQDMRTVDFHAGPALVVGGGILFGGDEFNYAVKGLGVTLGYQFEYSPAISNLIGDTHAVGGHRLTAGGSYAF